MSQDSIDLLLDRANAQMQEIEGIYQSTLNAQQPATLPVMIKNVVENYRSALDYLAVRITGAHGKPGGMVYYPLAPESAAFDGVMDSKMPGVRAARPDIAAVIAKYQPYNTTWVRPLNQLARENKHNSLSPQERRETVRKEVGGPRDGVSWDPSSVKFGEGVYINGERVDPRSQQTRSTVTIRYVDWLFSDLGRSVLGTLKEFGMRVPEAVGEIRHQLGL